MSTRPRSKAAPARRPALRVVGGAGRRGSGILLLAAAVVVTVFVVVALQAYLAQVGFRTAQLEREVAQAEDRFALLRAEVAELSSPDRVNGVATELGMGSPPEPVFLPAPEGLPSEDREETRPDYATKRLGAGTP